MKKVLAYVSGKYTDPRGAAFESRHIEKAREIAVCLWSLGIPCICPHTNSQHFDGATDYQTFLDGCLVMVEHCDLLVMVPNWTDSKGAKTEKELAEKLKIPVFFWPSDILKITELCWPNGIPPKHMDNSFNIFPFQLMGFWNQLSAEDERVVL